LSTLRGCPPRWGCGGGISGAKIPHCSSVRSEGYGFRYCPSIDKYALLHWGSMRQLSPNSCFLPSPVSGEPLSARLYPSTSLMLRSGRTETTVHPYSQGQFSTVRPERNRGA